MKAIRTAPMTRSQEFQWFLQRNKVDRLWRLGGSHTHASVRHVVQSLVEDFETLRTVFDYVDGDLRQIIQEPAPCIAQVDWPADERPPTVQALGLDLPLGREAFVGMARVRFALAEQDSKPTWLAMEADHTNLDGASVAMVDRYVCRLLGADVSSDYPDPMPYRHPRHLADYEASPAGQRERTRARRYLATQLAGGPLVNYPEKDRQNTAFIEWRRWIVGGRKILRAAARRLQADPSILLLGVFAFVLSVDSRNESPHVNVWASNRFSELRRSIVGTVAQGVPVTVRPRRAGTCFDYVSAAADAFLPGYRHATYAPRDLMAIAAEFGMHAWTCDVALNFMDRGPDGIYAESMTGKLDWPPKIIHDPRPDVPYSVRHSMVTFGSDLFSTVLADAKVFTVTRMRRLYAAFEFALRRTALGDDTTKNELQRYSG